MINKILFIVLICIPKLVFAEGYIDIGIGLANTDYVYKTGGQGCITTIQSIPYQADICAGRYDKTKKIRDPMGIVEIGYMYKNNGIFFLHISSIPDADGKGMNIVGIKHQFTF